MGGEADVDAGNFQRAFGVIWKLDGGDDVGNGKSEQQVPRRQNAPRSGWQRKEKGEELSQANSRSLRASAQCAVRDDSVKKKTKERKQQSVVGKKRPRSGWQRKTGAGKRNTGQQVPQGVRTLRGSGWQH
jgi:hypothetical protein